MRTDYTTMSGMKAVLLVILIGAGLLVLAFRGHALTSSLMSNVAWVNLNKHLQQTSPLSEKLGQTADLFQKATSSNLENRSAWFGQGLTYALRGDVQPAITSWKEGNVLPDTLKEYGLAARRNGELDAAIIYFRGADALRNEPDSAEYYLAGSICQRSFGSHKQLSKDNAAFCTKMLAQNKNNLFLNGDFAIQDYYGWEGAHHFADERSAHIEVENSPSEPGAPYLRVVGSREGNHFGLFQKFALPPGSTVRFSGRFKADNQENLAARLLYIEWQGANDQPQGNHGALLEDNREWAYFERTFTVPDHLSSFIDFYPVVLSGQGSLWFDDIRLELVDE